MSDYVIGLTGGIASGKSALEQAFIELGIEVVDADRISREVVEPGQPGLARVVERFGEGVLDAEGRLDRAALRRRIFEAPQDRAALEAILHPLIRTAMTERCRQSAGPYVLAAIPLLAENNNRNAYAWIDRVLVVDAPVELQRERLMARDDIDAALADRMIAAQATRPQRLAIADDVVVNDRDWESLRQAARELDRLYRCLAAARQAAVTTAG